MPKTSSRSQEGRIFKVAAGSWIFKEGDLGTEMFVIHAGEIEIVRDREPIALLEKGDFFGEMSLLEEVPRSAGARARTEATLLRVDGAMFTDLVASEPEFAVCIMRRLSQRVRWLGRRLDGRGSRPVPPVPTAAEAEKESVNRARLVHRESGTVYRLNLERPALIGRRDAITGVEPQVDLTAVDTERSSSRRHARLEVKGSQLMLIEELGATNGTFVNEKRIRAGVAEPVAPGDKLQFGLVTLELEKR